MTYEQQLLRPEWQHKRLEILRRDNYTCQFCGETDTRLNVHHLVYLPNCKAWEYDNEYLLTLCEEPCHLDEEKMKELDKFLIAAFNMTGLSRRQLFHLAKAMQLFLRGRIDSRDRFEALLQLLS